MNWEYKVSFIQTLMATFLGLALFSALWFHSNHNEEGGKLQSPLVLSPVSDRKNLKDLEWLAHKDALNPSISARFLRRVSGFKDQVLYFHFWAYWCRPCHEELPLLKRIQDSRLKFVLVNLDSKMEDLVQAEKLFGSMGLEGVESVSPGDNLKLQLGVDGLPYHLLLDAKGRLAFRHRGNLAPRWDEFKELLRELYRETTPE